MEKIKQVLGIVIFVSFVCVALLMVGVIILVILTKLGLISAIIVAGLKAFGFIFAVVVGSSLLIAGILRLGFWGFKQTILSMYDLAEWRKNQNQ
jgi:hypothetical protein